MRSIAPRLRALLALSALLTGCSGAGGGPHPTAVSPPRSAGDAPVEVEIAGRGFEARVRTDFAGGTGDVEAGFRATLTPTGGGTPVALESLRLTDRQTLLATVPAGLARGWHDLAVTDAADRTGFLAAAFQVVTPPDAVAAFALDRVPPQRAGATFTLCAAAVDAAGALVDGFEGTVAVADATGTLAPAHLGPFARGRACAPASVRAAYAADVVTATDAEGRAGSSPPFAVTAGPPAGVAFAGGVPSTAAGGCGGPFTVELRDRLDLPALAAEDLLVAVDVAPPGMATVAFDAACAAEVGRLVVPAGAGSARFWVRAGAPGPLTLRARPDTLPSATLGLPVTP